VSTSDPNNHQQVTCLLTSEDCVSDTVEVIELELDKYLATPTMLTSLYLSFRSGVFNIDSLVNCGDDTQIVTHANTS